MLQRKTSLLFLAVATAASIQFGGSPRDAAIVRGQVDDFGQETDTTMGWRSGVLTDAFAPVRIANGGPAGPDDAFLLARSSGLGGSGSKLVIFNDEQWTGDYKEAGVNMISMHLNNLDSVDLMLRLRVESDSGGSFVSRDSVFLAALSGWQLKQFPFTDSSFVGTGNVDLALRTVNRLRFYHSATREWSPREVKSRLGIDNIVAVGGGTGVEVENELREQRIASVYPNPARDRITIELSRVAREQNRLGIFDILGRRVLTFDARTPSVSASVVGLAPGLYWIGFIDGTARAGVPISFIVSR